MLTDRRIFIRVAITNEGTFGQENFYFIFINSYFMISLKNYQKGKV